MVDVPDPPDLPQFLNLRDPWEVEACSVLLSSGIQPAAYDLALASLQYSEALEPAVPGPREVITASGLGRPRADSCLTNMTSRGLCVLSASVSVHNRRQL